MAPGKSLAGRIKKMFSLDGVSHKAAMHGDLAATMLTKDAAISGPFATAVKTGTEGYARQLGLKLRLFSDITDQNEQYFLSQAGSDHLVFEAYGIPAIHVIERLGTEQLTLYHQSADTIGSTPQSSANSPAIAEKITKSVLYYLREEGGACAAG
jgi:hypothetical protein